MQSITPSSTLIAIDFETADYKRDSACALGMTKIQEGRIVDNFYSLIRPPRKRIYFTHIHNIRWNDVADSPTFPELWPAIAEFLEDGTHLVAHNASFDKGVMNACCMAAAVSPPALPYICTVQMSRRTLSLPSHSLDNVCKHFSIQLDHHHAGSDAAASAKVLLCLLDIAKPGCWQS